MAGNKVNAKAKGKDERGKGNNKLIVSNNDEPEDTDFSLIRKPIQTSITGFAQARKIFDMATEELKGLLSEECDLLYECKVCRNLFRSLVNFISHKRVYCQSKFNTSVHGHFTKSSSTVNEFTKIMHIEEGYQESLKKVNKSDDIEIDDQIPMTKDLTTIIEKIAKNKGTSEQTDEEPQITLHKIPSTSIAVFQNFKTDNMEQENMKTEVTELDGILSRNIAVLQTDGKYKIESSVTKETSETQAEGVIQISDDEDNENVDSLKCRQCDMRFSTQKTLKFHMKYKHVDTRVVYPCPDCLEIFSTSWSVYRHLFKVHRKSAAQIRRLRESIQAKSFRMNNPPAFYERRKNNLKAAAVPKITEEERLDQENQAWMDNMECDGEVPRCGGCGRTFERRAALAAHTHTCQPRSRALRRPDGKRIEIQIRKDYNKGPVTAAVAAAAAGATTAAAQVTQAAAVPPTPAVVQVKTDVNDNKTLKAKDIKELKEVREESPPKAKLKKETEIEEVKEKEQVQEQTIIPNGEDDSSKRDSGNEPESKSSSESPEKVENSPPQVQTKPVRLPFAQHAEKSNLMALRQRVVQDVELETLRCKKCDTRCGHIQELYDHVARHYNWMRYACKLCNFKHYNFEKLPEHVKVVHKLKGDKDFYFSTVKAIDGTEACELALPVEEAVDVDETSSNSRRPSRCSSDSSRLSDDSSSSSTRIEGAKKRKLTHRMSGRGRGIGKRRRSVKGKYEDEDWIDKDDSQSNVKAFEENSSDMDDTYERIARKRIEESVASRRPVRRKTKPKNEDFEYDLSNLLKMEAQGYRDSQNVTPPTKSSQTKKKISEFNSYEILNKECCGALVSLSRKAVENARAHMKTAATLYVQRDKVPSSIFARPMVPKGLTRGDKLSPKKEVIVIEEKKDDSSTTTETSKDKISTPSIDLQKSATNSKISQKDISTTRTTSTTKESISTTLDVISKITELKDLTVTSDKAVATEQNKETHNAIAKPNEKIKPKSISIPSVVPLKIRSQSMEVIKNNPIINKNISEFTKAGMKTKILVIKPINRKSDGIQTVNTPLKFQTIKLKEAKKTSSDDTCTDQVVVVKVPKVDCITRTVTETSKPPAEKMAIVKRRESTTTIAETKPDKETNLSSNPKRPPSEDLAHASKNGDVETNKPEPMEVESNVAANDDKPKTNLNDPLVDSSNTISIDTEMRSVDEDSDKTCSDNETSTKS